MPCVRFGDTVVCGFHPQYEYGGYLFEVHPYCGPTPLNRRTGDPRATIPARFWSTWDEFGKLSPEEQRQYAVEE